MMKRTPFGRSVVPATSRMGCSQLGDVNMSTTICNMRLLHGLCLRPFFFPFLVLATKYLQDDNNAVCSESLVLPLSVPILSWYFYIHTNILAGSIISLHGYEINALAFICHHCYS